MRRTEIILVCALLAGIVMKLLHLPFASVLIILSGTLLSIIYYFFSFALLQGIRLRHIAKKDKYMHTRTATNVLAILMGFAFAICITGITFKLQFWPGSAALLWSGLVLLLVVVLLFAVLVRKDDTIWRNGMIRSIVISIIAVTIVITPGTTLADIYYRDKPAYRDALKDVMLHPNDAAAREHLRQLRDEEHGRTAPGTNDPALEPRQ